MRDVLERLAEEGKIRWYGWSTDDPERARRFAQGQHCTAVQHWLNLPLDAPEMLAVCKEYDQASINRAPLGSGMLTDKFSLEIVYPKDDMRSTWNFQAPRPLERMHRVEAVRNLFAGDARTLTQVALAWIWTRSDRTIPIPGFKTLDQVKENIQAMELGLLSKEQMTKIDEIFGRTPVIP